MVSGRQTGQCHVKRADHNKYLNTINLGKNSLGVKVAARRYFNKEVSDLTLSECAVLAGITQNPSKFNPVTGQKANSDKQKVILQYMVDQGYISGRTGGSAGGRRLFQKFRTWRSSPRETSTLPAILRTRLVERSTGYMKERKSLATPIPRLQYAFVLRRTLCLHDAGC